MEPRSLDTCRLGNSNWQPGDADPVRSSVNACHGTKCKRTRFRVKRVRSLKALDRGYFDCCSQLVERIPREVALATACRRPLDVELLVYVVGMILHCAHGNNQLGSDLFVCHPLRHELQDFQLAVGQGLDAEKTKDGRRRPKSQYPSSVLRPSSEMQPGSG